jgi:trehalose 6-phosphate synthase
VLERRPDLRERVVHLVLLSPSRRAIPEYNEYVAACVERADRINERFGTAGWVPVELTIRDNYPSTLAAYRRYDVLVVNPIFDGMNLVSKEGPILNERDGVLVLSSNAGAAAELAPAALMVNPFDVEETAAAITAAVGIPPQERRERAARLRGLAAGRSPARWLRAQLKDLSSVRAV